MKIKIFTFIFCVSFFFIGNLKSQTLTVVHNTAEDMATEIATALAGASITDFSTIEVVGTADMTNADCRVVSNYFPISGNDILPTLDLSDISFLDNEIKTTNPGAFENAAIQYVVLPDNLEKIGDRAFIRAGALIDVQIPDGVKSIGKYVFQECKKLTLSALPSSLETLGEAAFRDCEEVTFSTLPAGVSGTLSARTFQTCKKITVSELPAGITALGSYVFRSCSSITSMTFPKNFVSIGNQTFYDCTALESICFKNSTPPTVTASGTNDSFGGTTPKADIEVCVPKNAMEAYNQAPWNEMKLIKEDTTVGIKGIETGNKIQVYPNPAKHEINISGNISEDVIFYDITGKCINNLKIDSTKRIDISTLPQGFYFIKIDTETIKIIKK